MDGRASPRVAWGGGSSTREHCTGRGVAESGTTACDVTGSVLLLKQTIEDRVCDEASKGKVDEED